MLTHNIHLKNKKKSGNFPCLYVIYPILSLILLSTGACNPYERKGLSDSVGKETLKEVPAEKKGIISFTVDKIALENKERIFTLHLQYTGLTPSPINNYNLKLTLQEKGGSGTTLSYLDASNHFQSAASIQKELTNFTTKKTLEPTDFFDIPITIQPGSATKKVDITVTLISPDSQQTVAIIWEGAVFTPITDKMVLQASGAGDKNLSKLLQSLQDGEELNPDTKKEVMLHAAEFGNQNIFKALLKIPGMNVNCQDQQGNTALHIAADKGDKAIVKILLKARAKVNKKNNMGQTPLIIATLKNHASIKKLLSKTSGKVNKNSGSATPKPTRPTTSLKELRRKSSKAIQKQLSKVKLKSSSNSDIDKSPAKNQSK